MIPASFMDKLPPELLSSIFLKTISEEYHRGARLFNEFNLRPLRISHVSRRWREVAISYRHLWSYFCIRNKSRPAHIKATFDLFQERSSGAPLYFDINIHFADFELDDKAADDVVHIITSLVEQQHRWVDAKLYWSGGLVKRETIPQIKLTNIPMLSVLYLATWSAPIVIDTRQSPRLKRIDVSGDIELLTERKSEMPGLLQSMLSSSLTFVRAHSINATVRSCLDFLQMAPFLEKLRITFEGYRADHHLDGSANSASPVLHAKLRSLQLIGNSEPQRLLEQTVLPSLTALDLKSPMGHASLIDFFQRSAPPLTFLRMDCYDKSESAIIEILRLLPTLRELQLIGASVTARFFQELTIPVPGSGALGANSSATAALCPDLEVLGFFPRGLERPESTETHSSQCSSPALSSSRVPAPRSRSCGTRNTERLTFGSFGRLYFVGTTSALDLLWDLMDARMIGIAKRSWSLDMLFTSGGTGVLSLMFSAETEGRSFSEMRF